MEPGTIIYGAGKNPARTYFPEVVGGITPALQETERMEAKMEPKKIAKLAWSGAVAAAAFLMAPQAHATAWCPTPSDNVIRCNSCFRELTCDVNGFTIYITGNLVTLDGKSHWSNYAPGSALEVSGVGNTVKYFYVQNPGMFGLTSSAPYDGSSYTVFDHVYVYGAGHGIVNRGPSPVTVNNSTVTYSRITGVDGWPATAAGVPPSHNTDIRSSTLNHSGWDGYFGEAGPNCWLTNSTFAYNGGDGAFSDANWGAQIIGNTFYGNGTNPSNQGSGLHVSNIKGVVRNNYGRSNYFKDCYQDSYSWPGGVYHSGNDWGTSQGPDCSP
jgi:hypothetical protein